MAPQVSSTTDEPAFRSWYAEQSRRYQLDPNPDAPEHFYDWRAAFRAGAKPDDSGHWPSTFKQAGHPNEVVGGFNTRTGERVPGTLRARSVDELVSLGWDRSTATRLMAGQDRSLISDPLAPAPGQRPFETQPAQTVRPPSLISDPFGDESNRLTDAARQAQATTPDKAARVLSLQRRTGFPTEVIESNLDELERKTAVDDFDVEQFRAQSPLLANWLAKNPQNFAVAQDDLAPLSRLERALQVGATSVRSAAAGATFDLINVPFWSAMQLTGDVLGLQSFADYARRARLQAQQMGAVVAGVPASAGPTEQAVYSGFRSLGSNVPAAAVGVATGGAPAMLGILGGQVGLSEYGRARDAGVGVASSTLYGLNQAGIEVLTEEIPAHRLLGDLAKKTGFFRTLFRQGVAEVPGEQLATVFQDLNEWAVLHPDAPFSDYLKERPSAAAQTLIATLVSVGGTTALTTAVDRALGSSTSERVVRDLNEAAAASKTRTRAPAAVNEFLADATKDGLTHVYAPADAFTRYFQERGEDPDAIAAALTGDESALSFARVTGGDLAIPTPNYLAQIPGSGHEAFFEQELRLSPDGLNARETKEAIAAEADRPSEPDGEIPEQILTQRQQVYDRMVEKLEATGRYTTQDVQAQASFVATMYAAAAAPRNADVLALFERFEPTVVAEGRSTDEAAARTRAAVQEGSSDEQVDIPPSAGNRGETAAQRRTRREGHLEALTSRLLKDAQQVDPNVEPEAIRSALDTRLAMAEEQQQLELESGRGRDLLSAIAGYGGLWWEQNSGAYKGEIEKVAKEGRDVLGTTRGGKPKYARGRATWNGVAGVFQEAGLTPDAMVEALRQDARFDYIEDINGLIDAIDEAMRARSSADVFPGTAELLEQGVKPGTRWWDPAGVYEQSVDDISFDPTQFEQDERGSFEPSTRTIRLLKTANRTTLLHELGHLFLDIKSQLASEDGATDRERADMATLLRWFGFEGDLGAWRALTDEERRGYHEQFADAWEKYLGEGKAPTQELQPLFSRFFTWIVGFYKSLRRLRVELTDEVRAVMDRMVATEEAIAATEADASVRALFVDAAAAGVPESEFEGYRAKVQAASDEARARLQARLMRELAREKERAWQEQRDQVRAEIGVVVQQQPVYRAMASMKGQQTDGSPLPDGIPATPLARDVLVAQFGRDILEQLRGLYSADSGLPADTVAEIFGFPNGEALIGAMLAAPPMEEVIDQRTDDRMLEEHGSLLLNPAELAEAARQAIASEHRETVIRAELAMLNKLRAAAAPSVKAATTSDRAEQRAGERAAVEHLYADMPDEATLQRLAQQQIASMRLRNIRPDRFFAAARRHSRNAVEFAASQKFEEAVASKRDELVNLALYREALAAREAVDGARQQFAQMFKPDGPMAKRRNMDYVHAARAIAATYFWPERRLGAARDALALIEKHDPETYEVLEDHVRAALASGTELEALTFEAFTVMRDAVDALWEQSRREQQMLIDGQLVDRNEVVEALQHRFDELGTPNTQEPRTEGQMLLLGMRAALRRVESWVSYVDGGDPNGLFRRYLWTPISEATATYRIHKAEYLQKYLDLVQSIEKTLTPGRIPAPELGFTFESRAQLLHALLHSGNESNFQKLLRGYKWGSLLNDGTVDRSRWDRFLTRAYADGIITKADMDFVQATWDLVAELKPQAQQAHREMYGTYFSEITAWPVETPWGTYAGGYVPAVVDPLQSADASVRNEKQSLTEGGNAFMFPTTGRGFTKARIESYAKPLALDLRLVPQHLDKVLRFIHLEPRVKDAGRLLWNHGFRERLNAYDPTVGGDLLVPWLQRAASQRVTKSSQGWAGRGADTFFRAVRNRTGLNMMAGNVINTLQQFTGLFVSATKVQPRYLRNALWKYVTDHKAFVDFVHEADPFMRTRLTSAAIEIQQHIDDLLLNPSKYEQLREFGTKHGYFLQSGTQNIVDIITWGGAYEQATENGADHEGAVRQAAAAVRETQGSFAPEDVSKVEVQVPFLRAFVMFYGYFNMLANLNGSELAQTARDMGLRKGAGRALYIYTFGFMAPAVISEVLRQAIGGWDDDDDETHLDELMNIFFGSQARTLAAFVPGGVLTAAYNYYSTDTTYDDRISSSPAISLIESAIRAPGEMYRAVLEDGPKKRAVRDMLDLVGLFTGLPVGALKRPAGYLADVVDDKEQPDDVVELTRGLISGRGQDR